MEVEQNIDKIVCKGLEEEPWSGDLGRLSKGGGICDEST